MEGDEDEMGFRRARSDEQRQERRDAILSMAASMLAEMPVGELSLNELSRRVGLAKSALLNYFESREAVLLEVLDGEMRAWITSLENLVVLQGGSVRDRTDHLASAMVGELVKRPTLCDLIGAQAGVLERNVTTEIILRHKRSNLKALEAATAFMRRHVPELELAEAGKVFAYLLLVASAAWPHARPTTALQAAYDSDAGVASLHMDFTSAIKDIVTMTIAGALAQR